MFRHIINIIIVICLFPALLNAQEVRQKQLRDDVLKQKTATEQIQTDAEKKLSAPLQQKENTSTPPSSNKNTTIVYMDHADFIMVDEKLRPGIQLLNGNVKFRHDNALMYCDSAYFHQEKNSMDAFGNVRIIQADTIFVYGDVLYYDGNTKLARLRHNVRMENKSAVLTTDSLNYDRMSNLAYYYTGGQIKDDVNTLTSIWGQYSPDTERALFRKNVHLVNPNFTMDADTLKYNTQTKIADIVGPTHIIYQDDTEIFSERGWYDTTSERSLLLDRSLVVHQNGKTLIGDTIFYDKQQSFGEAFKHVALTDSAKKTTLNGNYVYYNELTEFGLANDSALLVEWSGVDTLYVHADTLQMLKDSIFDMVKGYYNVRIFRNDLQGICDSLVYTARDSTINMYRDPVSWAEDSQLSGDFIKIYIKDQQVDRVSIQQSAIASQQVADTYFNQLSGKEIIAYVDSGALYKIYVDGNAETVFFPFDDSDSLFVAMNKIQSSFVRIHIKDQKLDRMSNFPAAKGNTYPLSQLTDEDLYLRNFFWAEEQRPIDKDDVFRVTPKVERRNSGAPSASASNENTGAKASGNVPSNTTTRPANNTNNSNPPQRTPTAAPSRTNSNIPLKKSTSSEREVIQIEPMQEL